MSIERYFCVDSKEGLPHIKKIIPSKAIAILRPNDDAIKKFRKTLLLLISKKYIPLKTYFISDSNKGLPHIKKIILSKVIAILRPHDDIIIFLGKKYFSRISPLKIH